MINITMNYLPVIKERGCIRDEMWYLSTAVGYNEIYAPFGKHPANIIGGLCLRPTSNALQTSLQMIASQTSSQWVT